MKKPMNDANGDPEPSEIFESPPWWVLGTGMLDFTIPITQLIP